ncbi:MAG: SDR family NAD(P)-dependent oxidoreductase [Bacteroidetes bacterium]|nr:SDR family NAD(P)-dependent oxidoreductase [Bacteroidota bacterium]
MTLTDKVVLITGASGGIGAATAKAFHMKGASIAIAARQKDKLEELAQVLPGALVIPVDLSDEKQVKEMVAWTIGYFGRINILVNNAASIIVAPAETVTQEDMLKAFQTNLLAPLTAIQQSIVYMRKEGRGHIINVGSPGYMMGIPYYLPYVCSKAALSALTRTLQAEWAGTEIIVSEYFPGYIKTDSRPESRVGEVGQDFLMSPKQNFLTHHFTKPKTAEYVANQILRLAEHPKTLVYTTAAVKIGAYISNISWFRLLLAKQMAETARNKLGRL